MALQCRSTNSGFVNIGNKVVVVVVVLFSITTSLPLVFHLPIKFINFAELIKYIGKGLCKCVCKYR